MTAIFSLFFRQEFLQKAFNWRFHLLLVLCILVYSPSLFNGYGLDDELVIQNHPLTNLGIKALPEIWNSPYYKDDMGYSYGYRPVVLSSFALEYSLWGCNPYLSHLLNILLYALLCILILQWLEMLLEKRHWPSAFAVTVLFALYPLHTEVVCSLKNREEILSLAGGISAAIFLFRNSKWPLADFCLSVGCFLLGMLSKNTIFLFPLILPAVALITKRTIGSSLIWFGLITPLPASLLLEINNNLYLILYIFFIQVCIFILWNFEKTIQFRDKTSQLVWVSKDRKMNKARVSFFFFLGLILLPVLINLNYNQLALMLPAAGLVWIYLSRNSDEVFPALFYLQLTTLVLYLSGAFPALWSLVGALFLLLTLILILEDKRKASSLALISLLLSGSISVYSDTGEIGLLMVLPFIYFLYRGSLPTTAKWTFLVVSLVNFTSIQWTGIHAWASVLQNLPLSSFFLYLWYCSREKHFTFKLSNLLLTLLFVVFVLQFAVPEKLDVQLRRKSESLDQLRSRAEALKQYKPQANFSRPLTEMEVPLKWNASIGQVSASACWTAGWYLGKLVLPYPMICYYGYKQVMVKDWSSAGARAVLIILGLVTFMLCFIGRKYGYQLIMLWLCLLFLLLPYTNALTRIPGMVADRYTFLPSLASSALIVAFFYAIHSLFPSRIKRLPQYFMLGMLLLYAVLSFSRSFEWKDRLTLFRADIQKAPRSVQLNNLLGVQLMLSALNTQDPQKASELALEAVQSFNRAIAIYPDFFNLYYDKGRAWRFLNRPDSAIAAFLQAKQINKAYPPLNQELSLAFMAKGIALEAISSEQAREAYENAIRADSSQTDAYNRLAFSLYSASAPDSAKQILRQGLTNCKIKAELWANLGKIHLSMAQPDSAVYCFSRALAEKPGVQEWETLNQEALRRNTQP